MNVQDSKTFCNLIDGRWVQAKSGATFERRNPAKVSDLVSVCPKSDMADVNDAVAAAKRAFPAWRRMPAPKRAQIIFKATEILRQQRTEIEQAITREHGKILKESFGDVQEALDCGYYAATEGRRLFGIQTPSELPDKLCMTIREPVGIAGLIIPWNFPFALAAIKVIPALLAGNTAVLKPASIVPGCPDYIYRAFMEAGLPDGVLNVVYGSGSEVGVPLVAHPDIDVVSFTGETETGRSIATAMGKKLKKSSMELGGKNALVIMEDANLDLAIDGVIYGGYGSTGQRCSAVSRVIVHEAVYNRVVDALIDRVKGLRIGNGFDQEVDCGPLVSETQVNTVDRYVQIGKAEGATLAVGGFRETSGEFAKGWFYRPTLFVDVKPEMRIAQEEIFGPVVSVIKVKSFEEAIQVLNNTVYGLSAAIYTENINQALRAVNEINTGVVYVNNPPIGSEGHLPFGGRKNSGNGMRENGWAIYDIFTELKTVFIDYSDSLQKTFQEN